MRKGTKEAVWMGEWFGVFAGLASRVGAAVFFGAGVLAMVDLMASLPTRLHWFNPEVQGACYDLIRVAVAGAGVLLGVRDGLWRAGSRSPVVEAEVVRQ